jgi:hypothetical protein
MTGYRPIGWLTGLTGRIPDAVDKQLAPEGRGSPCPRQFIHFPGTIPMCQSSAQSKIPSIRPPAQFQSSFAKADPNFATPRE